MVEERKRVFVVFTSRDGWCMYVLCATRKMAKQQNRHFITMSKERRAVLPSHMHAHAHTSTLNSSFNASVACEFLNKFQFSFGFAFVLIRKLFFLHHPSISVGWSESEEVGEKTRGREKNSIFAWLLLAVVVVGM